MNKLKSFDLDHLIEDFRVLLVSDDCSCRDCPLSKACEEDEDNPIYFCQMNSETFRDSIKKLYNKGESDDR